MKSSDNSRNNSNEEADDNIVCLSPQIQKNNFFSSPKIAKKSNFGGNMTPTRTSNVNKIEVKESKYNRMKDLSNKFIDSIPVISFMSLLTIYALFGDDIRLLTDKVWSFVT